MATGGPLERDVKDFAFKLAAKIRVDTVGTDACGGRKNLVAVSNKYDIIFVAVHDGFQVLHVSDIDTCAEGLAKPTEVVDNFAFYMTVKTPGTPRHLAVNSDSSILSVCMHDGQNYAAYLYDIQAFALSSKQPTPFLTIRLNSNEEISDLSWNPSLELASTCAVCFHDGSLKLLEVKGSGVDQLASLPPTTHAISICWSPKGKQIVVGKANGTFSQYDQKLVEKKSVPSPGGLYGSASNEVSVIDIFWESTSVFFVVYKPAVDATTEQPSLAVVTLAKDGSPTFAIMEDVCYGIDASTYQQYYMAHISEWNTLLCSSSTAAETVIVGRQLDNVSAWERWNLDDSSRAEVPMTPDYVDAFPRGLGLSFNSRRSIPINETRTHPPCPVLLLLSSEGLLVCFYMMYSSPLAKQVNVAPETLTGVISRTASSSATAATASGPVVAGIGGGKPAVSAEAAKMHPPPAYSFQPRSTTPQMQPSSGQNLQPPGPQSQARPQPQFGSQAQPGSQPTVGLGSGLVPKTGLQSGASSQLPSGPQQGINPQQKTATQGQPGFGLQPQAAGKSLFGESSAFGGFPSQSGTSSGQTDPRLQQLAGKSGQPITSQSSSHGFSPNIRPQLISNVATNPEKPTPAMLGSLLSTGGQTLSGGQPSSSAAGFSLNLGAQSVSSSGQSSAKPPQTAFGSYSASGGQTVGRNLPPGNGSFAGSFNLGQPIDQSTPVPFGGKTSAKLQQPEPANGAGSLARPTPTMASSGASKLAVGGLANAGQLTAPKSPSAVQSGTTSPDGTTAAQKITSKRRSANTSDDIFKQSIDDEVAHFERELAEMRRRAAAMSIDVGTKEEKDRLRCDTQNLVEQSSSIRFDTKNLNNAVGDLKTSCINTFATVALCSQLEANDGSRRMCDLLRSRPLDPVREQKMRSIRSLQSYVEKEIYKSNAVLDDQWDAYQRQKNSRRVMAVPPIDIIYRTISDNLKTIAHQKRTLERLESNVDNLRLFKRSSWRSAAAQPDSNAISTDLLCRDFSDSVTVNGSTTPYKKAIPPEKEAQLRDFLLSRKVTPVKSTAPKNLSSSKIVSVKELREMLQAGTDEGSSGGSSIDEPATLSAAKTRGRSAPITSGTRRNVAAAATATSSIKPPPSSATHRSETVPLPSGGGTQAGRSLLGTPSPGEALASILHGSHDAEAKEYFTRLLPGSANKQLPGTAAPPPPLVAAAAASANRDPRSSAAAAAIARSNNQSTSIFGGTGSDVAKNLSFGLSTPASQQQPPKQWTNQVGREIQSSPKLKTSLPKFGMLGDHQGFAPVAAQATSKPLGLTAGIPPPNETQPQQLRRQQPAGGSAASFNLNSQDDEDEDGDDDEYEDGNESDEEYDEGEDEEQYGEDEETTEADVTAEYNSEASGNRTGLPTMKPAAISSVQKPKPPASPSPPSTTRSQPTTAFSGFGAFKMPGAVAGGGGESMPAPKFMFGAPVGAQAQASSAGAAVPGESLKQFGGLIPKTRPDEKKVSQVAAEGTQQQSKPAPFSLIGASDTDKSRTPTPAAGGESSASGRSEQSSSVPDVIGLAKAVPDGSSSAATGASTGLIGQSSAPAAESKSTVETETTSRASASNSGTSLFGKPIAAVSTGAEQAAVTTTPVPTSAPPATSSTTAASVQLGDQAAAPASTDTILHQTTPAPSGATTTAPTSTSGDLPTSGTTLPATVTPSTSSSLFGGPSNLVFGQTSSSAGPTSSSSFGSGLFGQSTASAFGQPASTAAPVFGGQPTAPATTSAFVQPTSSTTSVFGQPSTAAVGSVFGQSGSSVFGQQSSSAFGGATSAAATTSGTSIFGQSSGGASNLVFGQQSAASTGSGTSVFGQQSSSAASGAGLKPFGFMAPSSFGQSPSGFGQPAFGQSTFGQPAASASKASEGLFGGGGFGLGGKPDAEKAKMNVFGLGSTGFGSVTGQSQSSGIFGQTSSGSGGFGTVKTQANISGAFSGGGGSVQSTGFGGFQKPSTPQGQFGGAPAFSSPPAFGTGSAFGAAPVFGGGAAVGTGFGNPPQFGSPGFGSGAFGGATGTFGSTGGASSGGFGASSAFGQGDGGGSNAFAALAQQNLPTFGAIAQQTVGAFGGVQQQQGFGGFGSPSQQSAFGSSGFGSPAAAAASPNFTNYRA